MNIINIYTLYSGALDQVASYFVLAECTELGCSSFIWQTYDFCMYSYIFTVGVQNTFIKIIIHIHYIIMYITLK